jgi:hypothetical protein
MMIVTLPVTLVTNITHAVLYSKLAVAYTRSNDMRVQAALRTHYAFPNFDHAFKGALIRLLV